MRRAVQQRHGTVELERLEDILYLGRPAYGQAETHDRAFSNSRMTETTASHASIRSPRSQLGLARKNEGKE